MMAFLTVETKAFHSDLMWETRKDKLKVSRSDLTTLTRLGMQMSNNRFALRLLLSLSEVLSKSKRRKNSQEYVR